MLSAASFDSSGSSPARASRRLSRPEPASRSGFSLAHDDRPFLSGHYEVTVPDLPLQHLAGPSSGPLARGSLLVPVCPGIGELNAACPLPWFESLDPGLASDLRFPFGVSLTLGITAFTPICYREAHLPKLPDPQLLPVLSIVSQY